MTQPAKSIPLTGVILGWTAPENNHPGRLFLDSDDGPEVVLNFWPEYLSLLQPLGDMTTVAGTRIEAMAKYAETRGTEVRYRPYAIKLLEPAPEGAPTTEPTRPAPRAPSRSAPAGDTQRDSIERQVAAKGAIELLSTKAIQASEFDEWFDHILDKIQGRQAKKEFFTLTKTMSSSDSDYEADPPSSVQRL